MVTIWKENSIDHGKLLAITLKYDWVDFVLFCYSRAEFYSHQKDSFTQTFCIFLSHFLWSVGGWDIGRQIDTLAHIVWLGVNAWVSFGSLEVPLCYRRIQLPPKVNGPMLRIAQIWSNLSAGGEIHFCAVFSTPRSSIFFRRELTRSG